VIGRRTVLICVTLIALMLAGAVWRIIMPDDWTVLDAQHRATPPFWLLFVFPAASASVVGVLYWSSPRASAGVPRVQGWRPWGAFVSISYCALLLLMQAVLIVMSFGVHSYLWAIYRTLVVLVGIMALVAFNQMPKLPYFERRFAPGGDLGPLYGPRYIRTLSRVLIVFMTAWITFILTWTPSMGSRPALFILIAAAFLLVWLITWRRHLGRKWRLEQLAAR
jgi:hypothetical protein